jgi:hypothetical protein
MPQSIDARTRIAFLEREIGDSVFWLRTNHTLIKPIYRRPTAVGCEFPRGRPRWPAALATSCR